MHNINKIGKKKKKNYCKEEFISFSFKLYSIFFAYDSLKIKFGKKCLNIFYFMLKNKLCNLKERKI